jgi:hypothetical protein
MMVRMLYLVSNGQKTIQHFIPVRISPNLGIGSKNVFKTQGFATRFRYPSVKSSFTEGCLIVLISLDS